MLQKRFFDLKELHNLTLFFESEDELIPLMYEAVSPDSEIFILAGKGGKAYALYIEDYIENLERLIETIEELSGAKIDKFILPRQQKKFENMVASENYKNYDPETAKEWAKYAVEVTPTYLGFLIELKEPDEQD